MSHVASALKYVETIATRGVTESSSPAVAELDTFAKREAVLVSRSLAAAAAGSTPGASASPEDVVMAPSEEVVVVPAHPAASVATNKVRLCATRLFDRVFNCF